MNVKINSNFDRVEVKTKFEVETTGNTSIVTLFYGDNLQNKSSVSCPNDSINSWKEWLLERIQYNIQLHNLFGLKLAGVK